MIDAHFPNTVKRSGQVPHQPNPLPAHTTEAEISPMGETMAAALKPCANDRQIGGDHYKRVVIQPWDAIHVWGLGFFDGNVVKYIARFRRKGGLEDLHKARHYLEKLIELEELKPPQ